MLQYKNHRFYWGSISFEIPDGFYLTGNPELEIQTGVFLVSPEKDYSLDISICEDPSVSAREELDSVIRDFTILDPISEISVNGLQGYQAVYCTKYDQYYEVQLNIPGGILNLIFKSSAKNIFEIKRQTDLTRIAFYA